MSEYKRLTAEKVKGTTARCLRIDKDYIYTTYDLITEEKDEMVDMLLNRLAELEDKIENGTLIELPCKVGDTLYYVNAYRPTPIIEENIVHTIEMFNARDGFNIRIWTQNGTFYANKMPNVFKTKAEAEQRLNELKVQV